MAMDLDSDGKISQQDFLQSYQIYIKNDQSKKESSSFSSLKEKE